MTTEKEDRENERWEQRGRRAAFTELMRVCMRELGYEEVELQEMIEERERVVASLQRICEEHGDTDWEEDLDLADVLDKHLEPYLEASKAARGGR